MSEKELEALFKQDTALEPSSELKGKIIARVSAEMKKTKAERPRGAIWKRWVPLVACFALVLVLGIGFFGLINESYQAVYIDVNPSVALHVNRFGNVNGVEYLNEDAEQALAALELEGLSAEDALESMISAYDSAGYFKDGAEIHISAVSEKNKNADKLLDKLCARAEKVKGEKKYEVKSSKMSAEEKAQAEEYGISPGKYRVITEVIEKHPEYTVEDLKDKSMAELKDLLNKGQGKNKK